MPGTQKILFVSIAMVLALVTAASISLLAEDSAGTPGTVPTPGEQASDLTPTQPSPTVVAEVVATDAPDDAAVSGVPSTNAPEPTHRSFPTLTPVPSQPDDAPGEANSNPDSAENPAPGHEYAPPGLLNIPKIGINAAVEYVGVDELGNMDVPVDYWNVAWYEPGTVPGDVGNSVLAGHVDSQTGPAVFWNLRDLVPGDHVYVTTSDGEELTFEVTEVATYPVSDVPLRRLFGSSDKRNLNLITCEGTFDQSARDYDLRRIVYTTLVR